MTDDQVFADIAGHDVIAAAAARAAALPAGAARIADLAAAQPAPPALTEGTPANDPEPPSLAKA